MRPFLAIMLTLTMTSGLAIAQERDDANYLTPKDKKQTRDVLRRLPVGLASMPAEAIYRLSRTLNLDRWDRMMDKPEVQTILSQTERLRKPVYGSAFPFENFASDFVGIVDRNFGVCSGYATLQRNFNLLMHFDPKNTHKAVVPNKEKNIVAYYDFYRELIEKAAKLQPVIIPHYSNLTEFLTEPYFQVVAKQQIVKQWAKNNTSIQGIEQFALANSQYPKKRWPKLYKKLKERLDSGYNPIVFSSFNPTDTIKFNIHVIQVMGVSEYRKDGSFEIYIWDDGVLHDYFGEYKPEKLPKVITFRADGAVWWLESEEYLSLDFKNPDSKKMMELRNNELIDETLWIDLLPNDDRMMAKMIKHKIKWCASKKELNKYCQ